MCNRESPRGVVVNMRDCDIVLWEFELQPSYYIPFHTNTIGIGLNFLTLIPQIWVERNQAT